MRYVIKIVQFENHVGRYRSFQDREPYTDLNEAISTANTLRNMTGKCYGVFGHGPDGPTGIIHATSAYYAKTPEGS